MPTRTVRKAIAVDVGGHSAKGRVVSEGSLDNAPSIVRRYPSAVRNPAIDKRDVSGLERREAVTQIISELRQQEPEISHFGIATTGVVDPDSGIVILDQSPTYQGTSWPRALLEARAINQDDFLYVENDANAGAWAEFASWPSHPDYGTWRLHHPKAQSLNPTTFIRVTVGSGVGSAIIIDDKLLRGSGCVAGEFAFMRFSPSEDLLRYVPPGELSSPHYGTTEFFAGSPGILRRARFAAEQRQSSWARSISDPEAIDIKAVARGYEARDPGVVGALRLAAAALANALLNIIYLLGPDVVLVGGGVVEQVSSYLPLLQEYVASYDSIPVATRAATVGRTQIPSDDAAALGVGYLSLVAERAVRDFLSAGTTTPR